MNCQQLRCSTCLTKFCFHFNVTRHAVPHNFGKVKFSREKKSIKRHSNHEKLLCNFFLLRIIANIAENIAKRTLIADLNGSIPLLVTLLLWSLTWLTHNLTLTLLAKKLLRWMFSLRCDFFNFQNLNSDFISSPVSPPTYFDIKVLLLLYRLLFRMKLFSKKSLQ